MLCRRIEYLGAKYAMKTERSYLFVPGNRPDRFEKACESGADAIILDLEDAVPVEQKLQTRTIVSEWLTAEKSVYVRVNGADTEFFMRDVEAINRPGLKGVFLPKAETRQQIMMLNDLLRNMKPIIPTLETAKGVWNVLELASAPNVKRLAFGSVDFQMDTGIKGEDLALLYVRTKMVLASSMAKIEAPIDGVTTAIDDQQLLLKDIQRAVDIGLGAKLCIHPKQVETVNGAFLPSDKEVAWARQVVAVAEASGGAATRLGSELVDKPVIDKAKRIIALSEIIR
jgi:citrate lyase subunit beta/citryl-CoA lyase